MSKRANDTQLSLDTVPKKLVNINECEELIQKNKKEKVDRDSDYIKEHIRSVKKKELEFYASLRLDDEIKDRLFKVPKDIKEQKKPFDTKPQDLVILAHPIEGNLLMTENELRNKYMGKIKP